MIGLPPTSTVKAINAHGRQPPAPKRAATLAPAPGSSPNDPPCTYPQHHGAEEEHEGVVGRGAASAWERVLLQSGRVVGSAFRTQLGQLLQKVIPNSPPPMGAAVQDHELHEEGEAEAPEEHEARGEAPELEALPHEVEVQVQRLRVQEAQRAQQRRAEAHRQVEARHVRQPVVPGLDAARHGSQRPLQYAVVPTEAESISSPCGARLFNARPR
ncbi:hypothetical protein ON010_g18843 [Phytophthora cinnamomi]|nr:hypothetical protein ON010_g18843 [Phytophthora cinnamomi]